MAFTRLATYSGQLGDCDTLQYTDVNLGTVNTGDLIVGFISGLTEGSTSYINKNSGTATLSSASENQLDVSSYSHYRVYYVVSSGGTLILRVENVSFYCPDYVIARYSGVNTSSPLSLDVTATVTNTSTPTSNSFSPTSGYLIVSSLGLYSSSFSSFGSGFTNVSSGPQGNLYVQEKLSASSGSQTSTFNLGSSTNLWNMHTLVFAAGAPATKKALKKNGKFLRSSGKILRY